MLSTLYCFIVKINFSKKFASSGIITPIPLDFYPYADPSVLDPQVLIDGSLTYLCINDLN